MSFAQIVSQNNPYNRFLTGMTQGMNLAQTAQNMHTNAIHNRYLSKSLQNQIKGAELANNAQSIRNQNLPQMQKAKLATLQAAVALAKFKQANPLLSVGGTAGQVGAAQYMQQHPGNKQGIVPQQLQQPQQPQQSMQPRVPFAIGQQPTGTPQQGMPPQGAQQQGTPSGSQQPSPSQLILNDIMQGQNYKKAMAGYRTAQTKALPFSLLPTNVRTTVLARAKGAGQDYLQASRNLASGKNLQDIATAQGTDLSKTPAIYPATTGTLTTVQKRGLAVNTIDSLNKQMASALAPYGTQILGYKPKQIGQMLTGNNPDQEARMIAAYALQPELQSARVIAAGGRMSVKLIDSMTDKAIGKLRVMRTHVSPQVFMASQNYMNKWISDAYNASLQSLSPNPQNLTGQQGQQGQQSNTIRIKAPDGQTGRWPANKALPQGFSKINE